MYFQILKTVVNQRYKSNVVLFQEFISKCQSEGLEKSNHIDFTIYSCRDIGI